MSDEPVECPDVPNEWPPAKPIEYDAEPDEGTPEGVPVKNWMPTPISDAAEFLDRPVPGYESDA